MSYFAGVSCESGSVLPFIITTERTENTVDGTKCTNPSSRSLGEGGSTNFSALTVRLHNESRQRPDNAQEPSHAKKMLALNARFMLGSSSSTMTLRRCSINPSRRAVIHQHINNQPLGAEVIEGDINPVCVRRVAFGSGGFGVRKFIKCPTIFTTLPYSLSNLLKSPKSISIINIDGPKGETDFTISSLLICSLTIL
jgi:hypothetical protein